ncbi:MAG: hypothetical protein CK425_06175 [Parachlamydia sp.]|nr:MAG: hypothetical protein CK425_06175 [Parachlamydia sp.]
MYPHALVVLGIPINDFTQDEAIQAILKVLNSTAGHKNVHYVSFVGIEEIMNIWGWSQSTIENREFLSVLLKATYVIPTNEALVWISKMLDDPLQPAIQESDFFHKLCERLAAENKSLFFLGNNDTEFRQLVAQTKRNFPKLRILGSETPRIALEGQDLLNMDDLDALLIEELNDLAPDVLWVSLGSPKQEIWFKRVKRRLKIPLAIGASFRFAETLHPTFFERSCHFFKKIKSFFKLCVLSLPLILMQNWSRLIYAKDISRAETVKDPLLFLSEAHSFVVFPLPKVLNQQTCDQIAWHLKDAFEHPRLIFDFREVKYIDLHGLSFLLHTMTRIWKEKKEIYAWGLSNYLKYLLKLHRLWFLLDPYFFHSPQDFIRSFAGKDGKREHFYLSIQQKRAHMIVSFFGFLGNQINYASYLDSWIPMVEDKGCVLDFTYCLAVDNRAFGFLLRIKEYLQQHGKSLKICGVNKNLEKEFAQAGVNQYVKFYPNLESALIKI